MDTSNRDARLVLRETLALFPGWRTELTQLAARVDRRLTRDEQQRVLGRCASIAAEVLAARVMLTEDLLDAPQRVAGHSRVVDVERAFDNVEAQLHDIQVRLQELH